MSNPLISHGRGGAGNIDRDSNAYADGAITREGPAGDQGDGAYSSGRGGAGNISSPHVKPSNPPNAPGDADVIPETALRRKGDDYANYHTGRGGEGNIHRDDKKGAVTGGAGSEAGAGTGTKGVSGKVEELKGKVLGSLKGSGSS